MGWSHTATPLSHPVFKNFSLNVFEQGEKKPSEWEKIIANNETDKELIS